MASMRMLSKILEADPDELSGSHCVVRWEEEGHPRSVVERKKIVWMSGIGKQCEVRVTEKGRSVLYPANLLACGKLKHLVLYLA